MTITRRRTSLAHSPHRHRAVRGLAMAVIALSALGMTSNGQPAAAKAPGPNGQIAYFRTGGADKGPASVHTINLDGTHDQLVNDSADAPHWSPDGTQIAMECNGNACGNASVLIVNPDTGASRLLPSPDPTLGLGCQAAWSPDGQRLLCGTLDEVDPSRNGIYTVRSSDGGGLTRITKFGQSPGDFSPDGKRVSFAGYDQNGDVRIYVVRLNGGSPTAITPAGLAVVDDFGGSWSPAGDVIAFVARPTSDSRRAIWVVNADGSGLRELPIAGCGGLFSDPRSIGCDAPSWSPDGTQMAFTRLSAMTYVKNIYTVNRDGSGLHQVTRTGFQDFAPDWGTHPFVQ